MARKTPEGNFNEHLSEELDARFPGHLSFKMDPHQMLGVPDRLILHGNRWATLETKAGTKSAKRPLQPERVEMMNDMAFSEFINPDNCDEVLDRLSDYFGKTDEG